MFRQSIFLIVLLQLFLISCNSNEASIEDRVLENDEDSRGAVDAAAGRSSFTSFDGTVISYLDHGEGEPVILLHGFINKAESWSGTALNGQLRAQGYRVIIPDLRGNGESGKPQTDEAYADNAEVKDLRLLLDHLGVDRIMAVGYSRGSIVLARWLTDEPRISRAIIGGMGLGFTDPDWDRRRAFAAAFGGDDLTDLTRGAVEYAQSIGADLRSLHLQQKHQPVTTPDELRSIEIPIVVIVGKEDKDNGDPGRLEELFPHGKLNIIPGDHNTTYRTEVFGAAAMAFLKG